MPEDNLKQRSIKSGFWVFGLRFAQFVLNFFKFVIIARLLGPKEFGLMGIALLVINILETFSKTGVDAALIQKQEIDADHLNVAWSLQVVRGGVLFLLLYFIAPFSSMFFSLPEARPVIQWIGVVLLLRGIENIGIIHFRKDFEFNKEFACQFSGTLIEFVVSVFIALRFQNVWALVAGLIAGDLTRTLASYLAHPHRPKFMLRKKELRDFLSFGIWVTGMSIASFLLTQGDDIFVGKFLGVTALGFYQLAYKISNLPATEITHIISKVSFPLYAKLQDDPEKLNQGYLRIIKLTSFMIFPLAGLIFLLSYDFTRIFLGEKWLPMVGAIKLLVIWGVIRAIGGITGSLFYALGKPKIVTQLEFVQLLILSILIYPLSRFWGINGTSLSVVLAAIGPNLAALLIAIKQLKADPGIFFRALFYPFSGAIVALGVVLWSRGFFVVGWGSIPQFFMNIVIYAIIFLGAVNLMDKYLKTDMIGTWEPILKSWPTKDRRTV